MDIKTAIGALTILIALVSYSFYFKDIFRKSTKPHSVSWLVWAVLNGVTFLTQSENGAGAGGWVTGFAALASGLIFLVSVRYGEKNITSTDWYCLVIALAVIGLWYQARTGTLSVSLASLAFIIGFIPTFRKSVRKPHQETAITYFLNGLKFLLALYALDAISLTTALYPATLAVMNLGFVAFLILRRSKYPSKNRFAHYT